MIAPYAQQVEKSVQPLERAHLRPSHVVPPNRCFHDTVAETLGDIKELGIEAEAVQPLEREYPARRLPFEQLETTLRVEKWESRYQAHHHIEKASGVLSER